MPSPLNLAKVSRGGLAALIIITQHQPAHNKSCVLQLLHRFPYKIDTAAYMPTQPVKQKKRCMRCPARI